MRRFRLWAITFAAVAMVACGGYDDAPAAGGGQGDGEVEVWNLTSDPLVQIGVVQGDEVYQLDEAVSSLRLSDGRIAVVNAGSAQLRLYDGRGRHLSSIGGDGDGPGEFRFPARVWRHGADSLRVWDARRRVLSYFGPDGGFTRSESVDLMSRPFALDVWVHRGHWIDSPVPPELRSLVAGAIGRLPARDPSVPLRYVRVTPGGRLWVANAVPPQDGPTAWQVYEWDGTPLATLTTPARFELHDIGDDYVLGRYRDELDVNFVRLYGLEKPRGSSAAPGLAGYLSDDAPELPSLAASVPEEELQGMKSLFMNLAGAQEMNYARNFTYVTDLSLLREQRDFTVPDGVNVHILRAHARGWIGMVVHEETEAFCVLAYGVTPIGWTPGAILCP